MRCLPSLDPGSRARTNPGRWRRLAPTVGILALLGSGCGGGPASGPSVAPAPETRQEPVVDVLHGVEFTDPYRWLEDQESPETRAWIDAQNAYAREHLEQRPERAVIAERLDTLLRTDRVGSPTERGGRFFVWKKRAEDDLWILYLRDGLEGDDQVLIDPHTLSDDHTTTVSVLDIDPAGRRLAYGVRRGGADEVEVRILDVDRREDLDDRLPPALYRSLAFNSGAVGPYGEGFFYGRRDRDTGVRIYHHTLGADPASDPEIFGQGRGPGQWIFANVSDDGRYLLIEVAHGWARGELFVQDLASGGSLTPLFEGVEARFRPAFAGDQLVVRTDWEAPNGRVLAVDLGSPGFESWREIVPQGETAIQGVGVVAGEVFVHTLDNVLSRLHRFDLDGNALGEVQLPGSGSASTPGGGWNDASVFFSFESFTQPSTTYRLDSASGALSVWSKRDVPFTGTDYVTSQEWFSSKDGTQVPMFVVRKAGLDTDTPRPTLLYGYGGFGVSQRPRFGSAWAWWIENGGVFALANIRGGSEFGEAWHEAGMLGNKQNVFDDFIAAAEHLIDTGITTREQLAIQGGSNGGLLVGAVSTQRPELFRAVLCQFPDLDMVRYYQFENNNAPALLEYGDASIPEQFEFLRAYSPYQAVRDGVDYPAVLLTSGDGDTRVPPLQARKMTARLQAATASEQPVFLLYDTKAGHAGGRPVAKTVEQQALELTFLAWQTGLEVAVPADGSGGEVPAAEDAPRAADPVDGTVASADGVEIGYTVWRHPDPVASVVLVHGWMCDRTYWSEQIAALTDHHTVVALDLAGHGRSGRDRAAWELAVFGADVAAVVESLDLSQVVLVGHSMGGPAVLEAAPRLQGRVLGVVGVDTFHNVEAKPPAEQWNALMDAYRSDFVGTCEQFVGSMFRPGSDPALVQRVQGGMCGGSPEIGTALMEQFGAYALGPVMAAAGVPVRAINAAEPFPTAVEINRKVAPDFEVVPVAEVGHFLMLERPEEFNRHLTAVVAGLAGLPD